MASTFPTTNPLLKFVIFSFLPGCDLFHKCALISSKVREKLPGSGLLNQLKVITLKHEMAENQVLPSATSFLYAVSLTDGIEIQVDKTNFRYSEII